MFIRSYLRTSTIDHRPSTIEQDVNRASAALEQFVAEHGQLIANMYAEGG